MKRALTGKKQNRRRHNYNRKLSQDEFRTMRENFSSVEAAEELFRVRKAKSRVRIFEQEGDIVGFLLTLAFKML